MGNNAVIGHVEETQKRVAVVVNCPHSHPHSVRGAAILTSGLEGLLLSGIIAEHIQGVLASEERCSQVVVKQD